MGIPPQTIYLFIQIILQYCCLIVTQQVEENDMNLLGRNVGSNQEHNRFKHKADLTGSMIGLNKTENQSDSKTYTVESRPQLCI